ncbi:MAG: GIY-YIG nuclease family protein [Planctomyces sp.]|nr:GIY-YIG nuclease family protein [Planctomyces sp.]
MKKWFVSANGKNGGPFDSIKINEILSSGKVRDRAFVKRDELLSDWEEVSTVPSFTTIMELPVACYCSECDTRVLMPENDSRGIVRCPECGHKSQLVNYLDDTRKIFEEIPLEPWGKFDLAVLGAGALLLIIGVCGAIALLFNASLSVLLGFVFLVTAAGLFGVTFHHRAQASRHRKHMRRVEVALTDRSRELVRLQDEASAMKRNFREAQEFALRDAREVHEKAKRDVRDAHEKAQNDVRDALAKAEKEVKDALKKSKLAIKDASDLVQLHTEMTSAMAERFLSETQKWWTSKMNGQNYQLTKDRITKAIGFVRKQGHKVTESEEKKMLKQLQDDYESVVKSEHEKAEQRRIKEQMREELRVERELKREMDRIEAEQRSIESALKEALKKAGDAHSAEVEKLRQMLLEAEERGRRTKSQAELTRVGHVYVISNYGAFGENTFKVGLTRRLDPEDRVKELGDASVPFPFDVHMMILSQDAPALERTLHMALHRHRVNRVNFRKEFFRVDIETIHKLVKRHHGVVEYKVDPEALEFRQTQNISDDDFAFLEKANLAAGMDDEDDDLDGTDGE